MTDFKLLLLLTLLLLAGCIALIVLLLRQQHKLQALSTMEQKQLKLLLSNSIANNKQLQQLKDNNLLGFEKNRSEIIRYFEKELSSFSEKIKDQLATIHLNTVKTLNQNSQQQQQAVTEAQRLMTEVVENALKRNTDSLHKMFSELRQTTDQHMRDINERVELRLQQGFEQTNKIFLDIKERLNQIDQAQKRISELSDHVITLQKTLDNKGARGAFGEVQLMDIIKDMIPEKYCQFQQPLSNNKRPDCIILLPPPSGKLVIDAKFPLENYQAMFDRDKMTSEQENYRKAFKQDIKKHINDISEKYIIEGETADGAVMFIPSEAVFAEIQAHHPDLVQHAQFKQVWMASPTTLMAILTTARAVLADAERSKQAKIIHHHLNALGIEFHRFSKRMDDLARHIQQANDDVEKITISSKKISKKFVQIEQSEFEQLEQDKS